MPVTRAEGGGDGSGDKLRRDVERRRVGGVLDGEDGARVLVEGKLRGERQRRRSGAPAAVSIRRCRGRDSGAAAA